MYDMCSWGCVCNAYVDPDKPVLVAGDPEQSNEQHVRQENGIKYHDALVGAMVRAFVV